VSAAVVFADLVAECKQRGESLIDRLDAIYTRYGLYLGAQHAAVLKGEAGQRRIQSIMDALRADPPTQIAGFDVIRSRDISTGQGRDCRTGEQFTVNLPKSNVLSWDLDGGSRVLVRPSGTEPKLKLYFEVCEPFGAGETPEVVKARAGDTLDRIRTDVLARAGL
jgi:phosphomannomutase